MIARSLPRVYSLVFQPKTKVTRSLIRTLVGTTLAGNDITELPQPAQAKIRN